jgi:hypothetical protein
MPRFLVTQKAFDAQAHDGVDRPAATVWYGGKKSKRGKRS